MIEHTPPPRWLQQAARLVRRVPWTARVMQIAMRLIQPRFTLGVVGVLLDDARERVLLVEHIFHPFRPWGLPGGWLDRGEDPADGIVREFHEETGLAVHVVCPLLVRPSPEMRRHMDIIFLCELAGPAEPVRLNGELTGCQWAHPDALPPLLPVQVDAIRAAFELGND